jgi:hypothetical protein
MSGMRERLTYANVMVTVLAFIVLGGTAWAVAHNSIGTKQLKSGAVHTADIADDAVTSPKVQQGSLEASDFAPGAVGGNATVRSSTGAIPLTCTESSFAPGSFILFCSGKGSFTASCEQGEHATGGGYTTAGSTGPPSSTASVTEGRPEPADGTPTAWFVNANGSGSNSGSSPGLAHPADPQVTVYAICSG